MTDIPTLIAELRRLAAAASIEGQLEAQETLDGSRHAIVDEFFPVSAGIGFIDRREEAAYLTAAANAVPLLCDEVERLRKQLDREEADHIQTIKHRDAHEDSLNEIFGELRMTEYDRSWTSLNNPVEKALDYIHALRAKEASLAALSTDRGAT